MLPWRKRTESTAELGSVLQMKAGPHGLSFSTEPTGGVSLLPDAGALLCQLEDEGYADPTEEGHLIGWDQLYRLLRDATYQDALNLLQLPALKDAKPQLASQGSLTDANFSIAVQGWLSNDRRRISGARVVDGLLQIGSERFLLSEPVWSLVDLIGKFGARGDDGRVDREQRKLWGEIRAAALSAGAILDDFLYRTVVVTPRRLQLALRREETLGVVEIEPSFDGAPAQWLSAFDAASTVRDRYDLPTPSGIVQVVIAPEVKTVLNEIKRMPGRRIAGERAEAFLINPVAALGEDAADVIDIDAFEDAKVEAGVAFDRFAVFVTTSEGGTGSEIGLVVTSGVGENPDMLRVPMEDDEALAFADRVETKQNLGLQLCAWGEFEFELDGDSQLHCDALRRAVAERSRASTLISYGDIYDLTGYSDRIDGIGVEKASYSPFIAKKNSDEGWFPENMLPIIAWFPDEAAEAVSVLFTDAVREEIEQKVEHAKLAGDDRITISGCPDPMPLREAEAILSTFQKVEKDVAAGDFDPARKAVVGKHRRGLVLKSNIDQIDYQEARLAALVQPGTPPALPSSLREDVRLKDHQLAGVAWMQHLFSLAPDRCRGALLADDMGLGKTLQILCLIAAAKQADPSLPPALIVAPLSLLENWRQEVEKFLKPGSLRLLTAYGEGLSKLRVPRSAIDEQLKKEGLVRFLKPGWCSDADVVLTTYETLRDLEFAFAKERWSIMVCDEAQKIKNPNTAMTRAAKKQQVTFRIACTGTPVENSLTDLWCLFDFVQPGLLGALNEFGQKYRRPIEAETEEERAKVEELRSLIAPQILRRMKVDVAKDLKRKIVDDDCRQLKLSTFQRSLYLSAVDGFMRAKDGEGASPFSNHLGLLHYLRVISTDPQRVGAADGVPELMSSYRMKAPKLDWLMDALASIQSKGEKAIVFCEFKQIQRLIRHYVQAGFGVVPDIINGDTSATAGHVASRQKRIEAFQSRPGFGVIILSPIAVGFGVNIQAANHVIHYTRTWNPAKEDQATDRAYRIGQERDVYVYYPVVGADDFKTFDVKLDELLTRKRALAGDMLNGTGDLGPRDFDLSDIIPTAKPDAGTTATG